MARKRRQQAAMPRHRAKCFPRKTRSDLVEWDITLGPNVIGEYTQRDLGQRIDIAISVPGKPKIELRLLADDAYELMTEIGRAVDVACGVT